MDPRTLLFQERKLLFCRTILMAASERIKVFTQSIGGKNKIVISEAFIRGCSHFCEMWSECGASRSKQIFINFMLKETIEVSFFALQANFRFTERKFDKNPLN